MQDWWGLIYANPFDGMWLQGVRAYRIFRCLSPLSRIGKPERNPLRVTLLALFASLPSILIISLMIFAYVFLFALVGMDIFAATSSSCNDPKGDALVMGVQACMGTQEVATQLQDLFLAPRVWSIPQHNFNSMPNALASLYYMLGRAGARLTHPASNRPPPQALWR